MYSRISRSFLRILAVLVLISASAFLAAAQDDSDPNSPTPILVTEATSTRAITPASSRSIRRGQTFLLGSKVVLTAGNIQLMDGEDASAFRIYAIDSLGHQYRFPVVEIEAMPNSKRMFSVTVALTDELGYSTPPTEDGDIMLYLTWRGLASNRVRLGLGRTGGALKDDPDSLPMPLSTVQSMIEKGGGRTITPNYIGYKYSGDRRRFLEQATFGPDAASDSRLRRIGLRAWLDEQFAATYPSASNPYPSQVLKPANAPADCDNDQNVTPDVPVTCFRDTYSMYQPQAWFFREAFYGDAQLKHRVTWALQQLLVTSGVDIQQGRHMVEYQKILANNSFGNYRQLMKDVTLNPTMGDYLSMSQSTKTNPNENYAREIMQLFTVGLFMLNQDGTLQHDAQGNLIDSYDQNVVNNMTRVMTGWSFCQTPASCPNIASGSVNYIDPMLLNTGNHDLNAKTLLSYPGAVSQNIPACVLPCTTTAARSTYALASLDQALDNIYNHPNVAPYVSKVLIQQLVTSDPTPAYVGRVAAVFTANRANPTQMKEVIKAILLDPEARGDAKTDPNFGKLREPVLLTTNFARAFGVRSALGTGQSDGNLVRGRSEFTNMAQTPFFSPTVFNFYPPGYLIPGTAINGPEFAIMNTGTSIARLNFINRVVFSTVNPPSATSAPFPVTTDSPNGTGFDFTDLQAIATADPTCNALVDELNRRMLHGTMSAQMKSTILPAVTAITLSGAGTPENFLSRTRQAVYLVATSSQFQVQR